MPSWCTPGTGPALDDSDARERLGIVPDEMDGGHLPALGHPRELVERLVAYRAEM